MKTVFNNNFLERGQFNHCSLFSGIGGFDLAAQWVGWNNVFQVEKDEWCRKVLQKNFPEAKRFGDIKEFNAKEYNGTIDIISGGFPCQPFSVAGKRKGKEDDRYLWAEMLRVVNEIKPPFVVGENVTGIIGMELDKVLFDLEAQGYTTETYIIPACSKNAWHRRDRVWIVAYSNCIRWEDEQKENGEFIHNRNGNGATTEQSRGKQQRRTGKPGDILSNATSERQQGQGKRTKRSSNKEEGERETDYAFANGINNQWTVEPELGRVANGIPDRLDRLKGLGNAIVPQVAFEIFSFIDLILRGEQKKLLLKTETKCSIEAQM
jgi:DNA (cytosine-5)-methyltransferase 1